MRVLLVDVGNSRVKWRFDDTGTAADEDRAASRPFEALALADLHALAPRLSADGGEAPGRVLVSSVADEAVAMAVERAATAFAHPTRCERIAATARHGNLVNGYDDPAGLGSDRWLAAIGAHDLQPTRPIVVASFGTATTIDFVMSADGRDATFVGGLILPGIDTMRRALARDTARLPDPGRPDGVRIVDFATNTGDAITSGIAAAQVGALAVAIDDACARASAIRPVVVLAGGGATTAAAQALARGIDAVVVPDLVLRGLGVVAREDRR